MRLELRRIRLTKRFPLAISRGVSTGSENVFVFVDDGAHVGLGECAPGVGSDDTLADRAVDELTKFFHDAGLDRGSVFDPRQVHAQGRQAGLEAPVLAGLDIALWDLVAKRAGAPLWKHLGFDLPRVPTSVTVGINPPEVTRERVPLILRETGCRRLKIKLGSRQGLDHDRAHFRAAFEAAKSFEVGLSVDANAGWSLDDARAIIPWLEENGCDYVEQPLGIDAIDEMHLLGSDTHAPIFVDESCHYVEDIPKLAGKVDGVNIKLMKCGGISGALAIIEAARASGLGLMIGCMGESSVSISAAAALTGVMNHIDLDSHLNLAPDPASGARLSNGVVLPTESPGHGATLCETP